MKIISLKLEDKILSEVDERLIKNRYSTRTELIRNAIREKLLQLEQDEIPRDIARLPPSSKTKEQALELLKKQGKKQGVNTMRDRGSI